MKIQIIKFYKTKDKNFNDLSNYYSKLLSKYAQIETQEIIIKEERKISSKDLQNKADGYNVLLSEKGNLIDTIKLAEKIEALKLNYSTINFIIGNAFGFTEEALLNSDFVLSLSPLTFPHEMAEAIILEQLFRCMNFSAGGKYHK